MARFIEALGLKAFVQKSALTVVVGKQAALARLPTGPSGRRFSVLPFGRATPDPEEKQLSAWGYAFVGLGYLAIIEGAYLAYKRYRREPIVTLHYGLAEDDFPRHKPAHEHSRSGVADQPPSSAAIGGKLQVPQAPDNDKERMLRIQEVIQRETDKTGSHTASTLFLGEKSTPEALQKFIDKINEGLRSNGKPELSLTALTAEGAHKMQEAMQRFVETLKEGALQQGPLERPCDGAVYFIDPDLDLVIEYDW